MKLFLSCAVAACCLLPLVAPSGVAPFSLYGCLACSLALLAPFRGLFAAVFFLRLTVGTVASRALSLLSIFVPEGVLQVEGCCWLSFCVGSCALSCQFCCAFICRIVRGRPGTWRVAILGWRCAVRAFCLVVFCLCFVPLRECRVPLCLSCRVQWRLSPGSWRGMRVHINNIRNRAARLRIFAFLFTPLVARLSPFLCRRFRVRSFPGLLSR